MSRFCLKFALFPFVLLSAIMVMIRAQPYDDHELQALFLPDDCAMPCFMGIRPGVTTLDEAIQILKASGWVDKVDTYTDAPSGVTAAISWYWNANAPFPLQMAYPNRLNAMDNRIDYINMPTTLSLGDIWLSLGSPSEYGLTTVQRFNTSPVLMIYDNYYEQRGFGILGGGLDCPYFSKLWHSTIAVYYARSENHMYPAREMHDTFFRRQVVDFDQSICKT